MYFTNHSCPVTSLIVNKIPTITFTMGFLCGVVSPAFAQTPPPPTVSEPQVNLGVTSFYDGFSGAVPGWAYLGTLRYASANAIKDSHGNDVPAFSNPKINAVTLVNQFSYTSTIRLGNATLGWNAIIPVVSINGSFDQPGATLQGNSTAIGDLTTGPQLQFDPVIDPTGHPFFVQRLELDALIPIGQYRKNADLNQGSGFYSINPYWAASVFPLPGVEMSWRLNYVYNFQNTHPAASTPLVYLGQAVSTTQAGQAAWVNFAASYSVTPTLHVGLDGYYFKQLENSKANGVAIANSKEQVLGIGPGIVLDIHRGNGKQDELWINTYTESKVNNRSRNGLIVQARYLRTF